MGEIDPERAAMRGELLDVSELQAVPDRDLLHRCQREVREVFVIDRIELVTRHQTDKVRELQGNGPFRLQKTDHARDEIVKVGHLSQDIVTDDEVGFLALRNELVGEPEAEEVDKRGNALPNRDCRNIRSGFDAERRDTEWQEMLQQVSVVAGQFDNEAGRAETQPVPNRVAIRSGVRNPRRRVRGEVRIFPKYVLRADILPELNEEAAFADKHMEREIGLHCVELLRTQKALAERGHTKIDERMPKCRSAKPAAVSRLKIGLPLQVRRPDVHVRALQ